MRRGSLGSPAQKTPVSNEPKQDLVQAIHKLHNQPLRFLLVNHRKAPLADFPRERLRLQLDIRLGQLDYLSRGDRFVCGDEESVVLVLHCAISKVSKCRMG